MKFLRNLASTSLLMAVVLGVVGCGDDGGGDSSAKLASCKQVCEKQSTVTCPISFPLETCKQLCDAHAQAPAACQDALKALSDCQLMQADICSDSGCETQSNAYDAACS
ncbi:MAG TPA: hypothetical protein VER11_15050 [Polyangiaceae bacterium]|nr:hypothetical protein [Polyangiaceae bacterium]